MTEINLGRLLAVILQAEAAFAAVQMYLSLTGAEGRRSALDAAARSMLPDDDYGLFTRVMNAVKSARSRRNDFAHGLWGTANELPNALLWIGWEDSLAYDAVLSGATPSKDREVGLLGAAGRAQDRYMRSIQVYRTRDLKSEVSNARDADSAIAHLHVVLNRYAKPEERDSMRQALHTSPLLRRQANNPGRGNIPPARS